MAAGLAHPLLTGPGVGLGEVGVLGLRGFGSHSEPSVICLSPPQTENSSWTVAQMSVSFFCLNLGGAPSHEQCIFLSSFMYFPSHSS